MDEEQPEGSHRNEVVLVGRLAAPAEQRELPSGDLLVAFRVVIPRIPSSGPAGRPRPERPRAPTVDTIDCVTWRGELRRRALGWEAGDLVEVSGALRRRFWKAGSASVSRTEVEVERGKRVRRAR